MPSRIKHAITVSELIEAKDTQAEFIVVRHSRHFTQIVNFCEKSSCTFQNTTVRTVISEIPRGASKFTHIRSSK